MRSKTFYNYHKESIPGEAASDKLNKSFLVKDSGEVPEQETSVGPEEEAFIEQL